MSWYVDNADNDIKFYIVTQGNTKLLFSKIFKILI